MKKVLIGIAFVVFCAIIGFGIYTLTSSNKSKAINALSKYYEEKLLVKTDKKMDKVVKISTETLINAENSVENSLMGDIYTDIKNNQVYVDLVDKEGNKDLFNIQALLDNNKLYFKNENNPEYLFFKTITDDTSKLTDEEAKKMLTAIKKAFNDSLTEKDFVKGKDKITLGSNKVSTTTYTIKFTNLKIYNIFEKILHSDNTTIKKVLSSSEIDSKEYLELLKGSFGIGNDKENDEVFTYVMYVEGKDKLVKQELKADEMYVGFSEYKNKNKQISYEMLIGKNSTEPMLSLKIDGSNDNVYVVSGNILSTVTIEGEYTIKNNDAALNISLKTMGQEVASIKIESKEISKDKEYTLNINASLNFGDSINSVSSKNTIIYDEKIPVFDTTGAKDYDKLTAAEKEIFEKLFSNLGING